MNYLSSCKIVRTEMAPNLGVMSKIKIVERPLPSTSYRIHYSLIILPLNTIQSEMLTDRALKQTVNKRITINRNVEKSTSTHDPPVIIQKDESFH
jgi:hypothetical protein